jgi:hypothetical protein
MWLIALMVWGSGQSRGDAGGSAAGVSSREVWNPPRVPGTTESPDRTAVDAAQQTLPGVASEDGVPVRIYIRNQMSKRFRLVEARVVLDDIEVVHETARPGQELERSFSALETRVQPGDHTLTATLLYEGRKAGPLADVQPDRFKVQKVHSFSVAANVPEPAPIHLIALERGGAHLPLEKKMVLEVMSAPAPGLKPPPGEDLLKSAPPP